MNARRITTCAMLITVNVVLSILTPIKLANFKFTFEAFPILVAGLVFGPIDGLIVGTLGSTIYQILFSGYGLMITTPLWVLPHAISGLVVGLFAKKNNFDLTIKQIIFISILSSILVTALNTLAIYLDSIIFGYYSFAYVFGSILIKILTGIILAIIYSLLIPRIISNIKKI